jgi:hypothetical protein
MTKNFEGIHLNSLSLYRVISNLHNKLIFALFEHERMCKMYSNASSPRVVSLVQYCIY